MSDLTRAEAIAELTEHLNHWQRLMKEGICGKEYGERTIKSFELAIDSLKTDEAYQLEYEKQDFIEIPEGATLGDMLLEILKGREDCIYPVGNNEMAIKIRVEQWESPYRKE